MSGRTERYGGRGGVEAEGGGKEGSEQGGGGKERKGWPSAGGGRRRGRRGPEPRGRCGKGLFPCLGGRLAGAEWNWNPESSGNSGKERDPRGVGRE